MSDHAKSIIHLYDEKGRSLTEYDQLMAENAALKAQIETLQRQVDMLLRRQVFFDAPFDAPTRH